MKNVDVKRSIGGRRFYLTLSIIAAIALVGWLWVIREQGDRDFVEERLSAGRRVAPDPDGAALSGENEGLVSQDNTQGRGPEKEAGIPDSVPPAIKALLEKAGETYADYQEFEKHSSVHQEYLTNSMARRLDFWKAIYKSDLEFFDNLILPNAQVAEATPEEKSEALRLVGDFLSSFRNKHASLRAQFGCDSPVSKQSYRYFTQRMDASLERWRALDDYMSSRLSYVEGRLSIHLGPSKRSGYFALPPETYLSAVTPNKER